MYFILRRVFKDHSEINLMLGLNYKLIHRERSPERFEKTWAQENILQDTIPDIPERLLAFIVDEAGENQYHVYKDENAYVMTSDGKTFERITES